MKKKKLEKYRNSKKGKSQIIDSKAFFIFNELAKGKTLEEVAVVKGAPFSEFITEINEHPRLVQAVKDGKNAGFAYWHKKLKKYMLMKECQQSLVKLWFANYMKWYDKPMPTESNENATVIINISLHKPKKKQQKLIDKYFIEERNV